jgi:molybdenum cofactor synthesis domain-containing protein
MEDSAAILIIGNEILSGKVRDTNSPYLIEELRSLGYPVARVLVISDSVQIIAKAVAELSKQFKQVLTSGGVGPTLDDVTLEGIAAAFELDLVRDQRLEEIIARHYGDKMTPSHLKMALLPRGTRLTWSDELPWPLIEICNIMVLPGDPRILRRKFSAARDRFRRDPWHLKSVYTRLDEGYLAPLLEQLHSTYPEVAIGSYPVYELSDYAVQITLESKDESLVAQALAEFREMLDEKNIVRIE